MTEAAQILYQAMASGDDTRVLELVRENPSLISARLPGNATPLLMAAHRRKEGDRGDEVYLRSQGQQAFDEVGAKHGATVLHSAAAGGQVDWPEFLLAHGADPEIQTDARQTPWAVAVRYKRDRAAQRITDAVRSRRLEKPTGD